VLRIGQKYKTVAGFQAEITERAPKVRQFFGTVKEQGKIHDTIWYDSGLNAEFAEWDLADREDTNATTNKP
jgi:hypothetical protein